MFQVWRAEAQVLHFSPCALGKVVEAPMHTDVFPNGFDDIDRNLLKIADYRCRDDALVHHCLHHRVGAVVPELWMLYYR